MKKMYLLVAFPPSLHYKIYKPRYFIVNMAKIDLETRCKKAIIDTADKINSIYNTLGDMNMKLCHIIKQNKLFYNRVDEYRGYE